MAHRGSLKRIKGVTLTWNSTFDFAIRLSRAGVLLALSNDRCKQHTIQKVADLTFTDGSVKRKEWRWTREEGTKKKIDLNAKLKWAIGCLFRDWWSDLREVERGRGREEEEEKSESSSHERCFDPMEMGSVAPGWMDGLWDAWVTCIEIPFFHLASTAAGWSHIDHENQREKRENGPHAWTLRLIWQVRLWETSVLLSGPRGPKWLVCVSLWVENRVSIFLCIFAWSLFYAFLSDIQIRLMHVHDSSTNFNCPSHLVSHYKY